MSFSSLAICRRRASLRQFGGATSSSPEIWRRRASPMSITAEMQQQQQDEKDLKPIPPPGKIKDDILIFFKLYEPEKKELRGYDDSFLERAIQARIQLVSWRGNPKVQAEQESSVRRKTSKYFATEKQKPEVVKEVEEFSAKRKAPKRIDDSSSDVKPPPVKKLHKIEDEDDDDFVPEEVEATPNKKLKSGSRRGVTQKSNVKSARRGRGGRGASEAEPSGKAMGDDDSGEDIDNETSASKSAGRGRGRGAATGGGAARGRGGGGRGGFMNFGERKDPPRKGEKEVPEGAPNCLAGLTFVISGTLDSLEREEAEDLIKRHGGRVTSSVNKKTNYLLCDEDIGGRKSAKASELGTTFLTEDGLFDLVRASNKGKSRKVESKKALNEVVASPAKKSPQKVEVNSVAYSKNIVHLHAYHGGDDTRNHLEINAHDGSVNDIAFCHLNKQLCVFTCGDDKLIKVWDAVTGSKHYSFEGHQLKPSSPVAVKQEKIAAK